MSALERAPRFWARLGPGLVWAGTAVGVSHLVQSTRAGAGYGLALAWVVIAAHATKYPAYEAGPRYVAATGRSLLEGYRRQGKGALALFGVVSAVSMWIVVAAVTLVTAAMASAMVSDALTPLAWSALLIAATCAALGAGRFAALAGAMKWMIGALTISTLASVALIIPSTDWSAIPAWPPLPELTPVHVGFLVAFAGWMPAPLDTSVWHSQWLRARALSDDRALDARAARLDFHISYAGTAALALCFVVLGAALLWGDARPLPAGGAALAERLVSMYTAALGPWARPIVLVAALATMLSTTFAVLDGYARAVSEGIARWRGPEGELGAPRSWYLTALTVLGLGALATVGLLATSLKALVDIATTTSFVTAPALAWLNWRAVTSPEVGDAHRPGRWLNAAHLVCIALLFAFALGFLVVRFGP